MKTLFLDLASHAGLLACVTEKTVATSADVDHRIADAEVPALVTSLLRRAGWDQEDLSQLACVVGPGGFTSLRVAVAFTNALAYALNIPSAGIHLSDIFGTRVVSAAVQQPQAKTLPSPERREGGGEDFFWLHSTKRHELFARGFGAFVKAFPEPQHTTLEEFLPRFPQGAAWAGELIPPHEEAVQAKRARRADLASLTDVLPAFLARLSYDNERIYPWYGRKW